MVNGDRERYRSQSSYKSILLKLLIPIQAEEINDLPMLESVELQPFELFML